MKVKDVLEQNDQTWKTTKELILNADVSTVILVFIALVVLVVIYISFDNENESKMDDYYRAEDDDD